VRFKQISLEEAFAAIFRTDALMDTLTAMARGSITLEQGEAKLASFKVGGLVQLELSCTWMLRVEMRPNLQKDGHIGMHGVCTTTVVQPRVLTGSLWASVVLLLLSNRKKQLWASQAAEHNGSRAGHHHEGLGVPHGCMMYMIPLCVL
jgi:hypothetical protein